jgi:hypothetical protein
MEPASRASSPYLLVFHDCLQGNRSKTSPREIGTVLAKWIEWHDCLDAQGKILSRGAIGPEARRVQGPFTPRKREHTQKKNPIVGYLLVDAATFDEAAAMAAGCPGLEHGFDVEVCELLVCSPLACHSPNRTI